LITLTQLGKQLLKRCTRSGEQGQGEAQPQGETAQGDNVEDVELKK
jgi:hypothetical protein